MNAKTSFLFVSLFSVLVFSPAYPQQNKQLFRVGVLSPLLGRENLFFETLRQSLQKLGYREGENITFVIGKGNTLTSWQATPQRCGSCKSM